MGFAARYQNTANTAESGFSKASIFDFGDREVEMYKFVEGTNKLDIVPYKVKSKKHPLVHARSLKVGDLDYVMDVWIHTFVGAKKDSVVCPKRTYGLPCPLCDRAKEFYDMGDKDSYGKVKAKRRCYYSVIDRMGEDAKIKLFDASYEWFEKEMCDEARNSEPSADFAPADTGKRIKFRASPETSMTPDKNGKFPLKPKSFQFLDRESIEDKMKDAFPLDEAMKIMDYDQIKALVEGETGNFDDDEEEEAVPSKSTAMKTVEEKTGSCPRNHRWGVDCDAHPDCSTCPSGTWQACDKAGSN